MSAEPTSFRRRRRWLFWTGGAVLVVLAVLVAAAAVVARRIEPYLREQITQTLAERLHARVELDSFHVMLVGGAKGQWGVVAEGRGLRIWPSQQFPAHAAQSDSGSPFIQLDEFNFHAPLRYHFGKPVVISLVRLSGFTIHVPPRSARQAASAAAPLQPGRSGTLARFVVERMECDLAELVLETDKPDKLPMDFSLHQLRLSHIAAADAVQFETEIVNPRPVGIIRSAGRFGPWQAADPGASPVEGTYEFDHADLRSFKGLAGTLHSTGRFQGTLRDVTVDGDAHVPGFSLDRFGSSMPLHTHFHARVDGTNGDTWLEPVQATLGRSYFTTRGRIVRMRTLLQNDGIALSSPQSVIAAPFAGGHDILLDIDIEQQHIDDFLRFINRKQEPLLTGIVTVQARLHILPGDADLQQRLSLEGAFDLEQAHFTNDKIQSKVDELSLRGQGRPGEVRRFQPAAVDSKMKSHFHMDHGVVTLPDLDYTVPGAEIQLKGTYGLAGGALSFGGNARMQATVSQMVGGWKGLLLKPADHLFQADGAGTLIPVRVAGTRDAPQFSVDLGGLKGIRTHPQRPEEQPAQQQPPASPQP
jgi:hypothetical protein